MDIQEIKTKRDKLEVDLFDLVYQFVKETGVTPSEIHFGWINTQEIGKQHDSQQLINCVIGIEV